MELAVMGSEDFVLGFKLVGINRAHVVREEELETRLDALMDDEEVGIVVLHNSSLDVLTDEAKARFLESVNPVVVVVGREEESDLREKVKRVIGIDLFKGG